MSVLAVFGQNLRMLTPLRGSQTAVASELGIGRVQYQRFLRSKSFPKPNLLKRICDYFGVDARVLTDPLTPAQLALVASGLYRIDTPSQEVAVLQEAIAYCCPDQDFHPSEGELPNGFFQYWRPSMARRELVTTGLMLFKSLAMARVARGFEYRNFDLSSKTVPLREREFRGMVLRQREGFVMVGFHAPPLNQVSMMYLRPIAMGYASAFEGFNCLARDHHADANRMVRAVLLELRGGFSEALKVARMKPLMNWDEVPEHIIRYIRPQGECF